MKRKKIFLGLIIFGLGLIGVLSMLTMEVPLQPEAEEVLKNLTPIQKKLLILINPTIMLMISVIIGIVLFKKVNLKAPIIERIVGFANKVNYSSMLRSGVLGGIISGILLSLVGLLFNPILPNEFLQLGESIKPTLAARLLYGGLTEEILMRFGLMTLIVWIASKLFRSTKPIVYWAGITISSLLFALGHFPVAYQAVDNPSTGLLTYILLGNTIGGILFGWLYWKKGLESAFLAHIFAHIIMITAEPIYN
jgi:membrane protease YdiL (CAAX protease family)